MNALRTADVVAHCGRSARERLKSALMVVGHSRELFTVTAEAAATLTGLLFVAISLAPRHESTSHLGTVQQVRAAASLLAFTSVLTISLFALIGPNSLAFSALV